MYGKDGEFGVLTEPSDVPRALADHLPYEVHSPFTANQPDKQPTSQPTNQSANQPSNQPADQPANQATSQPTSQPISQPTSQPAKQPAHQPTRQLINQQANNRPTNKPTNQPSNQPTSQQAGAWIHESCAPWGGREPQKNKSGPSPVTLSCRGLRNHMQRKRLWSSQPPKT